MGKLCTSVNRDPDVFMLVVPDERLHSGPTNCFIVRDGDSTLVVDTGCASEGGRTLMEGALREVGARPDRTEFFLTHMHVDHAGLLAAIAPEGSTVHVGRAEVDSALAMDDPDVVRHVARRIAAQGVAPGEEREYVDFRLGIERFDPAAFTVRDVNEGDVVRVGDVVFEVLDTSGHAPGHRSLYHRESGLLIGGDQVLFSMTPYVPVYPGVEDRLGLYLERLRAMRDVRVLRLLQSHGRLRDADDGSAFQGRVEWLVSHRERRVREYAEAISARPGSTGFELIRSAPSSARIENWASTFMVQRWCVLSNGMAALDHLTSIGRAEACEGEDGIVRYWPA